MIESRSITGIGQKLPTNRPTDRLNILLLLFFIIIYLICHPVLIIGGGEIWRLLRIHDGMAWHTYGIFGRYFDITFTGKGDVCVCVCVPRSNLKTKRFFLFSGSHRNKLDQLFWNFVFSHLFALKFVSYIFFLLRWDYLNSNWTVFFFVMNFFCVSSFSFFLFFFVLSVCACSVRVRKIWRLWWARKMREREREN